MRARSAAAAAAVAAGVLSITNCVREPTLDELAAQTIVVTQVAPGTDFTTYRTFAIGDSIDVVTESEADAGQSTTRRVDPALAIPTLEAIAAELAGRGYKRVGRTDQPDLGVGAIAVVRVTAYVPYGAWWGYGSATAGSWGYAGVPFSTGISSTGITLWRRGVLVIELYDLRAAREAAAPSIQSAVVPTAVAPVVPDSGVAVSIPVVWAAFIYGVLGELEAGHAGPPLDGVRQAFAQSPYLRAP